jgi:N6-adenosine-specific RNA methylase IME4
METISCGWIVLPVNPSLGRYKLIADLVQLPYIVKLQNKNSTAESTAAPVRNRRKNKTQLINPHTEFMHHLNLTFGQIIQRALIESEKYFQTTEEQKETPEQHLNNQLDFSKSYHLLTEASIKWISQKNLVDPCQVDLCDLFNVHYTSTLSMEINIESRSFIIFANSQFLISEMSIFQNYMKALGIYDLIVLDPPWPNKSVSRSTSYPEMDIYKLFDFPIKKAISKNAFVCMWVTNKSKYHSFIKTKLFPSWGLTVVAEWVWMKVTTLGIPVFDIDSVHRKPYEICIIGRNISDIYDDGFPQTKVIVACPSKQHSRKPLLGPFFAEYLSDNPRRLELFARCAIQDWTCWGNEVLKYNDLCFYQTFE